MSIKHHNRQLGIPVKGNLLSDTISECTFCMVYNTGKAPHIKNIDFKARDASADAFVKWAVDLGITDLVVHNIEYETANLFSTTKINLFVGLPMVQPELLIEAFLNGTLKSDPNFIKS